MPLRSPRPVRVGIVIGLAAASVVLGSMPALADSVRLQEWWLGKLDVSQAWQSSRGAGMTVAVLGDGVDASQDDLAGSVITGPDYTNSGRTSGGPYFGLEGTAAASLIAGHGHGAGRSDGVIGVAPAARILSVRVILSPGDPLLASTTNAAARPGAIATAIRYAVGHGAGVIDLPVDPGQPTIERASAQAAAGGSAAEKAAVAYALSKGVVLVAPAGDNGAGTDAVNYPAAYPGVISVGAFNQDFVKAQYSSRQPYVTLTAAGAGMIVAAPDGYTTMSSTAAASAVVAGMAALIRSKYPELTPAQVSRALTHSTKLRPVGGRTDGSGYGTADAAAAVHTASVLAARVRQAPSAAPPRTDSASPAQATTDNSAPHVLRAVVISAGILVLLLMMIAAYAAAQRRRARRAAAAAAERDRPGADRFASVGAGDADPMQEFFSAPTAGLASRAGAGTAAGRRPAAGHSRPGGSRPQAAHSGRGGHGGHGGPGGPGGLSGQGGPGHGSAAGPGGPGGPAGFAAANGRPGASDPFAAAREPRGPGGINGAGSGAADRTSRPARGPAIEPAARPASRRPKVSGTPPWEPAAKPDSELPWATSPAPHAARMPGQAPPRPAAPRPAAPRPAAPGQAAPGPAAAGPDPAWNVPPAPWNAAPTANAAPTPSAGGDSVWDFASRSAADAGAQGRPGTGADPGSSQDQGSRPIYVWNPAASTESFPAVPEDRTEHGIS